jgi:hypothetical protein
MEYLGIDRHLKPKPEAIQLHPTMLGCPLGTPNHRSKSDIDLIDSDFKAPARLFKALAMLERQVDQRHVVALKTTTQISTQQPAAADVCPPGALATQDLNHHCTPRGARLVPSITKSKAQMLYRSRQRDHTYL